MSSTVMTVQTVHANWQLVQHTGSRVMAAGQNPFDGVTPDFSVFGQKFTTAWQKALAGVWGLAFVFCAFKLIVAFISIQSAKRHRNASSMSERTEDLQTWGIAVAGVVLAGAVFGAVLAAFG